MKKIIGSKRLTYIFTLIPLGLFVLLSYGLLLDKLGFYWDDWPYVWTRLELGYHGLLRHFSFSRPVAGQIHNIAILITNGSPILAQIWGLCFQVFGSFCAGLLVHEVWPQKRFSAVLTALLFLAYPGFTMRPIAINFSFSYFLMGMLFISFILTVKAARGGKPRWILIFCACLISVLNLFASEYFFLLELLRPCFLYAASDGNEDTTNRKRTFIPRLTSAFRAYLPYLVVFAAGMAYRMFFNKTQTLHYEFKLLSDFKAAPLPTIGAYLLRMGKDCLRVIFEAWGTVFEFPNTSEFGTRSTLMYVLICAAVFCISAVSLFLFSQKKDVEKKSSLCMLLIGIIAILLAGQPFWLTESAIHFVFQNCRYTLPFILGVSLILTALLDFIGKPRIIPVLIASVFIGLAAGHLFVVGNEYRRDWTLTKDLFTQLKWRIPGIEKNTVVVTNVLPIRFSTDNSLTAPLNWIYTREYETDRIPYMLYTNTKREAALSGLESGNEIFQEYLSAQFFGNTDDMISIYYNAPGCVHVLDPEVDLFNQMIPTIDREAAVLNNYSRIRTEDPQTPLPSKLFGKENTHGWCWYYEQADLERQRGNWERAAALGDEAYAGQDHPNDPMERIPFIEAFAHMNRWEDALAQTKAAMTVTPVMNDPLCALWQRIEKDRGEIPVQGELDELLSCEFLK
ncbi:MAG: hypothetical protein IJI41_04805 [Anaerolineaceae bacterium]|nr:hypothetical protein [Anaerolineaceae bacterium]